MNSINKKVLQSIKEVKRKYRNQSIRNVLFPKIESLQNTAFEHIEERCTLNFTISLLLIPIAMSERPDYQPLLLYIIITSITSLVLDILPSLLKELGLPIDHTIRNSIFLISSIIPSICSVLFTYPFIFRRIKEEYNGYLRHNSIPDTRPLFKRNQMTVQDYEKIY